MIGGISGVSAGRYLYGVQPVERQGLSRAQTAERTRENQRSQGAQGAAGVWSTRRPASPETPVEPVRPVTPTDANTKGPGSLGLPVRLGADPVEMAVRMRIQYTDPADQGPAALEQGAEEVQKAMEEGECQTCKERKYQDGSDDPGVSFKAPTQVDPDQAAAAVRGHEMEHVTREQAKAQREDRKVVSQSVTYRTAICPECGTAYVSGGTTRTVTAAEQDRQAQQDSREQEQIRTPFSAVA